MSKAGKPEALVPLLRDDEFNPRMRKVAEQAIRRSGRLPNSARALACAGDLGAVAREFFEQVWELGTLPKELTLLIRYKVSSVNTCLYCSTHQVDFLIKFGVSSEKIDRIHNFDNAAVFDERERACLAFAEAMTLDASNIPNAITERFTAAMTPAERVEVALVAGAMGLLNKLNDSLRIPIEDEALDIVTKVRLRGQTD